MNRGRLTKLGRCLIKLVKQPVGLRRGILRQLKKQCQKDPLLKTEIEFYLQQKYDIGLSSFYELFEKVPNIDQHRRISENAQQRWEDDTEHRLRWETHLPPEVYMTHFMSNLCYYFEEYSYQLFLLSDTFFDIFKMADIRTVLAKQIRSTQKVARIKVLKKQLAYLEKFFNHRVQILAKFDELKAIFEFIQQE